MKTNEKLNLVIWFIVASGWGYYLGNTKQTPTILVGTIVAAIFILFGRFLAWKFKGWPMGAVAQVLIIAIVGMIGGYFLSQTIDSSCLRLAMM